jgi:hypothetical protein
MINLKTRSTSICNILFNRTEEEYQLSIIWLVWMSRKHESASVDKLLSSKGVKRRLVQKIRP